MVNIPAILNAISVGGAASDKRKWITKNAAYATLAGLFMAGLPFLPPQYAQYINSEWVDNVCTGVIAIATVFGVFGATDKVGLIPARKDTTSDVGPNDLSGGG